MLCHNVKDNIKKDNIKKKVHLLLIAIAVAIILASACNAAETYIDEEISLFENGEAFVYGSTNLDLLKYIKPVNMKVEGITHELTQKKDRYWLFIYKTHQNITRSDIRLSLPKDAAINHIRTKHDISISSRADITTITFTGRDMPLDIQVQYSMLDKKEHDASLKAGIIILSVLLVLGLVIYLLHKHSILFTAGSKHRKEGQGADSRKGKESHELDKDKLDSAKLLLNDTQLKIIDTLIENKGEASQTKIMHLTGIPKASLSRNIELLSQKEVILKFNAGATNYIKIHPSFYR
ncbi:hypothetical protein JXB31_05045 [Candidatus Woesearchaeota archaeon]|nr:hypothetical protein [Candidatus Woesearchaeota archaeon]